MWVTGVAGGLCQNEKLGRKQGGGKGSDTGRDGS